jgi:CheY-like chemotaxis protein
MRVLVVDDNADNAETLCLLLRLWGYEAVCADNGPDALSLAQQFRPEAAIVEMLLPGLSGDEVGRRLCAMPELRRGPLIALSGCAATRRRALDAGFDLFLLKPAEPDDIRAALGSHGLAVAEPGVQAPQAGYLEQFPAALRSTMRRPEEICAPLDHLDA